MGRPKQFEREHALQQAIGIFSEHGYEGSSTGVLLEGMGISRQSLYDTFGDKRQLYLEALQRYTSDNVGGLLRALSGAASPAVALESLFDTAIAQALADPNPRCLGISAICEFGRTDPEITALTDRALTALGKALEDSLVRAKEVGAIAAGIDIVMASQYLRATLSGIKLAARSGAPEATLRGIASLALRALH